ncbi:MAG: STAS domain-containing protein [Calditrichaeota bacterium]|nr:MAG: STAS domain-containing protein [Calditrichota bacterium]
MRIFSNLKGDILGGITTSVISLPLAIAFGVVAFAPLGEKYVALGALTGLYGVIVAGLIASILGGTPGQISVPTAPMSVMVTSIIATLLKDPEIAAMGENQVTIILLLVAMTIFMAGVLQIILGAIGGGKLIKYIPYPVIAGFMNGIAIIIFISQLKPFFGISKDASFNVLFSGGFRFETILVGGTTIVAMILAGRLIKAVPASLIGLLSGVTVYFILGKIVNPALLHLDNNAFIIGPIPKAFPKPEKLIQFLQLNSQIPFQTLGKLIVPALTLSVLASIDTLLTSVVTDMFTRAKHNSTRELFGQGLGNVSSAIFGGLPVAGSTLVTLVNVNSGGRTALAGVVNCATVLLIVLFLGDIVKWIPMAALAGILMVTAVTMIEYESINLSLKKTALANLLVIVAVTIITVVIDLIVAVLVGLIITAFLFIKEQINATIIRKKYSGKFIHSKKVRSKEAMQILEEKGDLIKVYELSGSLFFGTCDKLQSEIEEDLDALCIILDMKRVNTIDLTGAQLLRQMIERIREKGNYLLLSSLEIPEDENRVRMVHFMQDVGLFDAVGRDFIFQDIDHALEWAEDLVIQRELEETEVKKQRLALRHLSVFKNLNNEQLDIVRQYIHPQTVKAGDIIFREGDPGDKIYFILSGGVSVLANISENGRSRRLATFSEGVFFGDMAILENQPRSATVKADTDTELLYMTVKDFNHLVNTQPLIASKMLLGMAREMSYRLRVTTQEVRALAE